MVTGAGSGIGKHAAIALAQNGYDVVFAGRRRENLEAAAREANRDRSQTLVVPTDITEPTSVRELFAQTKQKFGRLDLLFNNAGISGPGALLEDLTYEDWKVRGRYESHRRISVHAGSFQNYEEPDAARRPHH